MFLFKSKNVGDMGEREAVKFLKKKGYKILETNFKTKFGEIDIIAKKDEYICFVEVKTRSTDEFGEPREAVDNRKQHKITSVAKYYIMNHDDVLCRFDVIEVRYNKETKKITEINHIEDAFWSK